MWADYLAYSKSTVLILPFKAVGSKKPLGKLGPPAHDFYTLAKNV